MSAPLLFNILLEGRAERTIVIKSSDTAVNLERWYNKEFALHKVFHIFSIVLNGQVNWFFFRCCFLKEIKFLEGRIPWEQFAAACWIRPL
jgi:hypothetical protein